MPSKASIGVRNNFAFIPSIQANLIAVRTRAFLDPFLLDEGCKSYSTVALS